ncbi:MAG: hypothetical protein CMH56_10290 [Myxococcales bacterium]|nr:hypothetical protein [Myxococcales bacterium]
MSDFKKQLSKWQQDKKVTAPEVPAVSPSKPSPAVPEAVTPTPAAVAPDGELSKEDQLLFFEAVVGMGVSQQAKPEKLGLVEDETDAEAEVAQLEAADRELFLQEALNFDDQAVKTQKAQKEPEIMNRAQPVLMKRVLKGLEVPSISCDLHGLTRDQASEKLQMALSQCHQFGSEMLLVIHGKGHGALREQTITDLNACEWVLTHFTAPTHLGADGARVVLMNKRRP